MVQDTWCRAHGATRASARVAHGARRVVESMYTYCELTVNWSRGSGLRGRHRKNDSCPLQTTEIAMQRHENVRNRRIRRATPNICGY